MGSKSLKFWYAKWHLAKDICLHFLSQGLKLFPLSKNHEFEGALLTFWKLLMFSKTILVGSDPGWLFREPRCARCPRRFQAQALGHYRFKLGAAQGPPSICNVVVGTRQPQFASFLFGDVALL